MGKSTIQVNCFRKVLRRAFDIMPPPLRKESAVKSDPRRHRWRRVGAVPAGLWCGFVCDRRGPLSSWPTAARVWGPSGRKTGRGKGLCISWDQSLVFAPFHAGTSAPHPPRLSLLGASLLKLTGFRFQPHIRHQSNCSAVTPSKTTSSGHLSGRDAHPGTAGVHAQSPADAYSGLDRGHFGCLGPGCAIHPGVLSPGSRCLRRKPAQVTTHTHFIALPVEFGSVLEGHGCTAVARL